MTRQPSPDEAETLDLILSNEAMANDYRAMGKGPEAAWAAEASLPLDDLTALCLTTAGIGRALLERARWSSEEVATALASRPTPEPLSPKAS